MLLFPEQGSIHKNLDFQKIGFFSLLHARFQICFCHLDLHLDSFMIHLDSCMINLDEGCQTEIHSGPKLCSEIMSQARLNIYRKISCS